MATAKKTIRAAAPAKKARTTRPSAAKRPAAKAPAPSAPPAKMPVASAPPAKTVKPEKPKKPKLVRDSFTIPKPEYTVLAQLKQRAALAGKSAKKSELLRAGIKLLAGLGDAAFVAAIGAVPAVKTGRPAKE